MFSSFIRRIKNSSIYIPEPNLFSFHPDRFATKDNVDGAISGPLRPIYDFNITGDGQAMNVHVGTELTAYR